MPRYSVLDGEGLDATVQRLQRQLVLFYATTNERAADLPEPWLGAVSLIGSNMALEGWDGTRWVPLGQVPTAAPPVFGTVITSPLVIPDPVGNVVPQLEFKSGDGDTITPGPYTHYLHLYADAFRITSGRNIGQPIAVFRRHATSDCEVGIGGWQLHADDKAVTKVLNIWSGATRAGYFDSAGNIVATSGLFGVNGYLSGLVQTPTVQTSSGGITVRGPDFSVLEGNGPLGSPAVQLYVGNAWGLGIAPTATVYTANAWSNQYNGRPLVIWKGAGTAGCGLGFSDEPAGIGQSIKVVNLHLGHGLSFVNWNDTAQSMIYCQQIYQASGQAMKQDIVDLDADALEVVRRLRPVRYRRLQKQLTTGELDSTDTDPPESAGFIAEEVAEVFPIAAGELEHGPGLEYAGLTALLCRALQRMADKVDELTARVAQLEGAP